MFRSRRDGVSPDENQRWKAAMAEKYVLPDQPEVARQPAPEPPAKPTWDWKLRADEVGQAEQSRVLDRAPKLLAEMNAEHDRDCAAYRFECKRWGDFLSVFIERVNGDRLERVTQSINIGQSRSIVFEAGRAPDTGSFLSVWSIQLAPAPDRPSGSSPHERWDWERRIESALQISGVPHFQISKDNKRWGHESNAYMARSRIDQAVSAEHQILSSDAPRPGRVSAAPAEPQTWDTEGAWAIVRNWPRPPIDDCLFFEGAGISLFVPAGLGREVYEQILREIAGETCIVDDSPEHGTLIRQGDRTVLMVRCPSKGDATLLPVPPAMRTAAEARAWTFGLTPKQFVTDVET